MSICWMFYGSGQRNCMPKITATGAGLIFLFFNFCGHIKRQNTAKLLLKAIIIKKKNAKTDLDGWPLLLLV